MCVYIYIFVCVCQYVCTYMCASKSHFAKLHVEVTISKMANPCLSGF